MSADRPSADAPSVLLSSPPALQESWLASLLAGSRSQSWGASFLFHVCLFLILAIVLGTVQVAEHLAEAPSFTATPETPPEPANLEIFTIESRQHEFGQLDIDALQEQDAASARPGDPSIAADSGLPDGRGGEGDTFAPLGPSEFKGLDKLGPLLRGSIGVGAPGGHNSPGPKQPEGPFGPRNRGMRGAMIGPTRVSEQAVSGALNWIARHQNADGSWSLDHSACCKHGRCSGPGDAKNDAAATALGLLPFFAAGQTHESKGPYRLQIRRGLEWLLAQQKPNGDLSAGGSQMYSHGLATIALCEAYGMTGDSRIGYAAQAALNFIMSGQNAEGGWRYAHGSPDSDLSVVGWQVMALKSGQMARLQVNPATMDRVRKYLASAASGNYQDRFPYVAKGNATLPMTSVGLLLSQYLGATRESPVVTGGVEYLAQNLPSLERRNIYSWYYATQAMHNVPGPSWDTWNRAMRRVLVDSQEKSGCEAGSWDPEKPTADAWGKQGGRMMVTSLSCLTLEVYYRYLPLYQLDGKKEK